MLPKRDVDDDVDDDDDEDVSIASMIRGMSIPGSSPDMAGRDIPGSSHTEDVRLPSTSQEPRESSESSSSESSAVDIARKDLPAAEAPRNRMRSRSPARERNPSRSRRKRHRSDQHRARRE